MRRIATLNAANDRRRSAQRRNNAAIFGTGGQGAQFADWLLDNAV
jgi:hypothetical protein